MEVGRGPNWGCSAIIKKSRRLAKCNFHPSSLFVLLTQSHQGGCDGNACSTLGREQKFIYVLAGRRGKRPLGRPMRRWEHNITTDLKVEGQEGVDWIQLAQNRYQRRAPVNTEHSAAWCYTNFSGYVIKRSQLCHLRIEVLRAIAMFLLIVFFSRKASLLIKITLLNGDKIQIIGKDSDKTKIKLASN
jgi:hypothetical protein